MRNLNLSVPDDFYEKKLANYKNRLNYSEIFRRAVSDEIEKIERKGELIEKLHFQISKMPQKTDEKARENEIERFTKRWGEPDSKTNDEESLHHKVALLKKHRVDLQGQKATESKDSFLNSASIELEISNAVSLIKQLNECLKDGRKDYLINYPEEIKSVATFFETEGFSIVEKRLDFDDVRHSPEAMEFRRKLLRTGCYEYGLFAFDEQDVVFIHYRAEKIE